MPSSSVHKALEKVLAREAKMDEKNLMRAMKDLAKVEKAYQSSLKDTTKARKGLEKVMKQQHKTSKALESAQKHYDKAQEALVKTDDTYEEKRHHETLRFHDIESAQIQLTESYQAKISNDEERDRERASAYITTRRQQVAEEAARDDSGPVTAFAPSSSSSMIHT
ncbi:hypothetical protein QCA50_000188 [Cerrena zonata]|uniref:Uncharacterized protein n=1 Tax=Cerrena zonata TaxID=2478898 RepID=A0AAW0GTZ1_9APHY